MKRIHLLKPGTFTAEDGKQYTFSAQDIRSIARSYQPALSEAPIVVGHPTTNAPAFGWIEKAEVDGDNLFVVPRQVNPAFADAVRAGSYKKVSAKLYGPDHPQNPVKGEWYLQHVGFLGGQPPAVKGLQEVQFAADDGKAVCVALEPATPDSDTLLRQFVSRFVSLFQQPALSEDTIGAIVGARADEPAFAGWTAERRSKLKSGEIKGDFAGEGESYPIAGEGDVKDAWDLAGKDKSPDAVRRKVISIAKKHGWTGGLPDSAKKFAADNSISLSEPEDVDNPKLQQLEQENAQLKAQAAAAKATAAKARQDGIAAFAEGLVKAGKLLPAERPILIELCSRIEDGTTVQLAEGGEKKDLLASFQEFLGKALPKRVALREAAPVQNSNPGAASAAFTAPPGYNVQADRLEIHQRAEEYMRTHKDVSYTDAVLAVENV